MTDSHIFIFSGTFQQACHFAIDHEIAKSDWTFIRSANSLKGFSRGSRYVRTGHWELHKECDEIEKELKLRDFEEVFYGRTQDPQPVLEGSAEGK